MMPFGCLERLVAALVIFSLVALLHLSGTLASLDRKLGDLRFRALQRPATGEIVVVQIDARSLRELSVWPWPRHYHAALLDNLIDAGATEIAFDVDFNARSNYAADNALAEALARSAGRVILPAFRQTASPDSNDQTVYDTLPDPALRALAQVGGINVSPSPDGLIRRVSIAHEIGGLRLPAMFALLAGPAFITDKSFLIDFGIDPASIRRLSYIDVLQGDFRLEQLAGKKVIVGSTAAELGDRFSVPIHRVMSGPVLQAMAYESLVQGRALAVPSSVAVLGGTLLLILALSMMVGRWRWYVAAGSCVAASFILEALALGLQGVAPVSPLTAPWLLTAGLWALFIILSEVKRRGSEIVRQQLTLSNRRSLMNRLIADSFDGIIVTDSEGRIELFNKAAEAILARRREESEGALLEAFLPAMARLQLAASAVGPEANIQPPQPATLTITGENGTKRDIEVAVGVSRLIVRQLGNRGGGERLYTTFTFRDISERKRTEECQRKAHEEALAANRAKTEFLANMSHELRTPLNAILGFSEMILGNAFGELRPAKYRGYIDDIRQSGQHLLSIINDVLDVSRIELGELDLTYEPFSLREALEACVQIARGWRQFEDRRFSVEIANDIPDMDGDQRIIKQAVLNLLSNAYKYSNAGDGVTLRATKSADGMAVISVLDSGIGIAAEHIADLVKPFYQVDSSLARKQEGAGVGLFLVSSYVALHGGRMTIDSALGDGTRVTLYLPLEHGKDMATSDSSDRRPDVRVA